MLTKIFYCSNASTAHQRSIGGNSKSLCSTLDTGSSGSSKELTDPHLSTSHVSGKDIIIPKDQDASVATGNCGGKKLWLLFLLHL